MKGNSNTTHCTSNKLLKWGLIALLIALFANLQTPPAAHAADIDVNTINDNLASGDGFCTLREAITNANLAGGGDSTGGDCADGDVGTDTITLASGAYLLNLIGAGEDGNTTGDLDITDDIIINGAGAGVTIIDGNLTDRVIHTHGSANIDLNNLTIQHGQIGTIAVNSGNGGGIYHESDGTMNLSHVDILNNLAGHRGGGLENAGTATLTNCSISGNESGWGGGLVSATGTAITTINNSTVSNNTADTNGGGLNIYDGFVFVVNSTFTGNNGPGNGGGMATRGTLTVNNSTISGNSTTGNGDGLYTYGGGTATISNSIVANNSTDNCFGTFGTIVDNGNNLEDTGSTCSGFAQGDPLLGALADNGGPTETHALQVGSPAIDAGNNGTCAANDQRGTTRPLDGDDDGTATCDIGAFELGELQCGIIAAAEPTTYQFLGSTVSIEITDDNTDNSGAELDCLRVTDIPSSHPHATSGGTGAGIETNIYWIINGLQGDQGTTAVNYTLNLTLPHTISPDTDAKVCKYPGTQGGFGWDCFSTSSTASTVTLDGIESLSEWAVGDRVGPTAVSLQSITTTSPSTGWTVLLFSILMLAIGSLWLRRSR